MQRLDKSLKKWGLPKVCSQRVYSFLCVQRGEMFCYDFRKNGFVEVSPSAEQASRLMYVTHKSSEKWVWLLEYAVQDGFKLVSDKYIKKKLLWENKVPFILFRNEWSGHKKYYLNHALRVPPRLGVLRKVDYERAVK